MYNYPAATQSWVMAIQLVLVGHTNFSHMDFLTSMHENLYGLQDYMYLSTHFQYTCTADLPPVANHQFSIIICLQYMCHWTASDKYMYTLCNECSCIIILLFLGIFTFCRKCCTVYEFSERMPFYRMMLFL